MQSDRCQVGVAEALGDLGRLDCGPVSSVEVLDGLTLEEDRNQEPAPLGAILSLLLDETLGPAEPTACRPQLASDCERHSQPARAPRSREVLPALDVRQVGTL